LTNKEKMKNYRELNIGEIVTEDFRTAEVFKKAGIDFCCGGNQNLEEACKKQNINLNELELSLENIANTKPDSAHNFKDWSVDFLCDYIVNTHHKTVLRLLPQLTAYTKKIAEVHGANHPELQEIEQLFAQINTELIQHLQKEEEVLFPAIKIQFKSDNTEAKASIQSEIARMTTEHESAGGAMDKINVLSKGYTLPADACNTYRVTYKLLEEFEDDLHIHVHLENNILYPKALALAHQQY
jgi:iron-sulfur cluster repair di-iron protein